MDKQKPKVEDNEDEDSEEQESEEDEDEKDEENDEEDEDEDDNETNQQQKSKQNSKRQSSKKNDNKSKKDTNQSSEEESEEENDEEDSQNESSENEEEKTNQQTEGSKNKPLQNLLTKGLTRAEDSPNDQSPSKQQTLDGKPKVTERDIMQNMLTSSLDQLKQILEDEVEEQIELMDNDAQTELEMRDNEMQTENPTDEFEIQCEIVQLQECDVQVFIPPNNHKDTQFPLKEDYLQDSDEEIVDLLLNYDQENQQNNNNNNNQKFKKNHKRYTSESGLSPSQLLNQRDKLKNQIKNFEKKLKYLKEQIFAQKQVLKGFQITKQGSSIQMHDLEQDLNQKNKLIFELRSQLINKQAEMQMGKQKNLNASDEEDRIRLIDLEAHIIDLQELKQEQEIEIIKLKNQLSEQFHQFKAREIEYESTIQTLKNQTEYRRNILNAKDFNVNAQEIQEIQNEPEEPKNYLSENQEPGKQEKQQISEELKEQLQALQLMKQSKDQIIDKFNEQNTIAKELLELKEKQIEELKQKLKTCGSKLDGLFGDLDAELDPVMSKIENSQKLDHILDQFQQNLDILNSQLKDPELQVQEDYEDIEAEIKEMLLKSKQESERYESKEFQEIPQGSNSKSNVETKTASTQTSASDINISQENQDQSNSQIKLEQNNSLPSIKQTPNRHIQLSISQNENELVTLQKKLKLKDEKIVHAQFFQKEHIKKINDMDLTCHEQRQQIKKLLEEKEKIQLTARKQSTSLLRAKQATNIVKEELVEKENIITKQQMLINDLKQQIGNSKQPSVTKRINQAQLFSETESIIQEKDNEILLLKNLVTNLQKQIKGGDSSKNLTISSSINSSIMNSYGDQKKVDLRISSPKPGNTINKINSSYSNRAKRTYDL